MQERCGRGMVQYPAVLSETSVSLEITIALYYVLVSPLNPASTYNNLHSDC